MDSAFFVSKDFFSIDRLLSEFEEQGYLHYENYKDFNLDPESSIYSLLAKNKNIFEMALGQQGLGEAANEANYRQFSLSKVDSSRIQENAENKNRRTENLRIEKDCTEIDLTKVGPYLNSILQKFKSLGRVRLAVMMPQSEILPHVDYGNSSMIRIHFPLITNENCTFFLRRKGIVYQKKFNADGSIYHFDTKFRHWVKNEGSTARLHMIIDSFDSSYFEIFRPLD